MVEYRPHLHSAHIQAWKVHNAKAASHYPEWDPVMLAAGIKVPFDPKKHALMRLRAQGYVNKRRGAAAPSQALLDYRRMKGTVLDKQVREEVRGILARMRNAGQVRNR